MSARGVDCKAAGTILAAWYFSGLFCGWKTDLYAIWGENLQEWLSFMAAGELSIAAVHRLIEKAGAERVGDDAAEELRRILEELAERVGKKAKDLASHAGRKTVKAEDVRLAVKEIIRE